MEEMLVVILQILLEIVGEALCSLPVDFFTWGFEEDKPETVKQIILLIVGGLLGGLSIFLFPNTFLHHGWSRLLNFIAAPLLAGVIGRFIAIQIEGQKSAGIVRAKFWRAMLFTLGLVMVRFIYAARS